MKNVSIDGKNMLTRDAAFSELRRALSCPPTCGKNLDALYDFLTDVSQPVTLTFTNNADMVEALAPYGIKLLQTLIEASIKNPAFKLVIDWGDAESDE